MSLTEIKGVMDVKGWGGGGTVVWVDLCGWYIILFQLQNIFVIGLLTQLSIYFWLVGHLTHSGFLYITRTLWASTLWGSDFSHLALVVLHYPGSGVSKTGSSAALPREA